MKPSCCLCINRSQGDGDARGETNNSGDKERICARTQNPNKRQSRIKMTKAENLLFVVAAVMHPHKLGKTSFHIFNVNLSISPRGSLNFHPFLQ